MGNEQPPTPLPSPAHHPPVTHPSPTPTFQTHSLSPRTTPIATETRPDHRQPSPALGRASTSERKTSTAPPHPMPILQDLDRSKALNQPVPAHNVTQDEHAVPVVLGSETRPSREKTHSRPTPSAAYPARPIPFESSHQAGSNAQAR